MRNAIAAWIALQLPPRVIYYAFIRFWSHATTTDEGSGVNPNEMTWAKAVELWERTHGKL